MTTTPYYDVEVYVDSRIIPPLRGTIIGRQLAVKNPDIVGDGIHSVEVKDIEKMSGGRISFDLPTGDNTSRDKPKITKSLKKIPVLSQAYEIARAEYNSFIGKGYPIDTLYADEAAAVIAKDEDNLVLQGWKPNGTDYEVPGLYTTPGLCDYSTAADFATAGNACKAVAGAIALIDAADSLAPAYNLTLNPVQWGELLQSRFTNGDSEYGEVLKLLNFGEGGAGRIFSSSSIEAGKGLMTPVDPARRFIELIIPKDMSSQIGVDSKAPETSPLYGILWEQMFPYVKKPAGLAKLTSI